MADVNLEAGRAEADDDGRTRKRAIWLFRIGRYGRQLWSFFGTNAGAVTGSAVGTAMLAGVVSVTTPEVLGLKPREASVVDSGAARTVATKRWDETSLVYPLEGRDARGLRVLFDLVVLSRDLAWVRGSDKEISLAARTLPASEIASAVFGRELTAALASSKEVIVAGVASIEGTEATEAERASRRAQTAAEWVERIVPAKLPITTLNLGQFRADCADRISGDSAWQRPLIVIAVREREAAADIAEALANALTGKTNVPSPACYTRFEMRGVR